MHNLYIEERICNDKDTLASDLAHHLYTRQCHGRMVIVADDPKQLKLDTHKQWGKIVRQCQSERNKTLNAPRIMELSHHIARMQDMRFSRNIAPDINKSMEFITARQGQITPEPCFTMYITRKVSKKAMEKLCSMIPAGGLVVCYT